MIAALSNLGDELTSHILLSGAALALGIAIALPLAVWASRNASVAKVALGFASLVQTIPALALLALFFPILLSLRGVFGESLPTLGFLPALMALTLYALLPILRNAVTAQANLEPGVIEAADGIGMTGWQKLRLVEAPLSAPHIMAGIRTAAVWTIGAATLATTIGQKSLGDPIFAGLQTQNWTLVLAGCIASAALALVADALLGLIENGLATRRKSRVWIGGGTVLAGIAAALLLQFAPQSSTNDRVVIGAKTFSEQYILARLIGRYLEVEGFDVEYRDGLGSAVIHSALSSGDIDVYVDYTGTIWANQMGRTDNPGRAAMYDAIVAWEDANGGVKVAGRLGFENAYGLAVRRDVAERYGLSTIEDLRAVAARLTIGGDPEFFERPEWEGVRDAYGLRFGKRRNFSPTFMYNALQSGEADVISAYTSDGRIAADDLIVLDDPKGAFPSYDAIVLVSPRQVDNAKLLASIEPLLGQIDVEAMRTANYSVDRTDGEKITPSRAAEELSRDIFDD